MNKSINNVIPGADITKCAARLGAEISNVRLSGGLSDEVMHAINQLLREHRVIFLRDQRHFNEGEQERFAARLGDSLSRSRETCGLSATQAPSSVHGTGHEDQAQAAAAFDGTRLICMLPAKIITSHGGKTVWSNAAAAYRDLPLSLRMLADELWAVHNSAPCHALKACSTATDEERLQSAAVPCETELPVVQTHPETGERALVLGNSVKRFVGLQKDTGRRLFDLLQSYIAAPQNTVSWNWKAGDVAIWDKRATLLVNGYRHDESNIEDPDVLSVAVRRGVTRVKTSKPQLPNARAA
ncbi:hypothetical protein WN73_21650 [Bradyrhizobium sp. CCBAU 45394]|uniref:TauD/TfdA dioxygenase family protein n=1 Tax=Bradyrhizobium sp. CCBAU 45394 TaxID=1325087 RepID=UPI00230365B1|nr:TauD/TfdA family dioxygenase [Bradyrhizobium sp. CCBAU 45394]MDA9393117.1 hypothetical protein [Bradyrhizobium sp. CCBAU 45394]